MRSRSVALAFLLVLGCASIPDAQEVATIAQADAIAQMAEATLRALGALNQAGKLTPVQYDRAVAASKQVGAAAERIAADTSNGNELTEMQTGAAELLAVAKEIAP